MTMEKPDKRVVFTWALAALFACVVPAALSLWLWRWQGFPEQLVMIFTLIWVALLVLTLAVYIPLRLRHAAYQLTEDQLIAVGGVFFRVEHRMPLEGIRHVTLMQGPLERRFDTAFLLVRGAGGAILIEGLSMEQATAWRQRLLTS